MKISKGDYEKLKEAIAPHNSIFLRDTYEALGYSDERYRWDLLHRSGFKISILYNQGLNDSHIDTALKRIIKENNTNK